MRSRKFWLYHCTCLQLAEITPETGLTISNERDQYTVKYYRSTNLFTHLMYHVHVFVQNTDEVICIKLATAYDVMPSVNFTLSLNIET